MAIGKPKMTEMSKPAEILYQAFVDELRWTKEQQWKITYYTVALIGAGVGLVMRASPTPGEKVMWFGFVAAAMVTHVYVVLDLQRHLRTTRARQWHMQETFSAEDRRLARDEPPAVMPDARGPDWLSRWPRLRRVVARLPDTFVLVLCLAVAVVGILAFYAIWRP